MSVRAAWNGMPYIAIGFVIFHWVGIGSTSILANENESAIVRLDDVDTDFAISGEYMGSVRNSSDSSPQSASEGLQVIALGDGQFMGTYLPGGLPGNGWNRQPGTILHGRRNDRTLALEGHELQVIIEDQLARVIDRSNVGSADKENPTGSREVVLRKVVRRSAKQGLAPPPNAYVLFDGRDAGAFKNGKLVDGHLQVGTELIPLFRDYQLHVEFLLPYMPRSNSQARGNSGVYLQSRYEIQILDTFGREGAANECGGIYKQRAPDLNMAFPPLSWQTYDIFFRSPRFDARGCKRQHACLTVLHNGVTIHDRVAVTAKTGAGEPEGPQLLPIKLQDHGNPIQFRNIWLVNLSPH